MLQDLIERLTGKKIDVDELTVLKQVQPRDGIARDIGDIDDIELDIVAIPVVRVLLEPQARAVHPARYLERSVVEQVRGIGRIPAVSAPIEILPNRQVSRERDELVEVGNGILELHLELVIVDRAHPELLARKITAVDRLAVLDDIENERVLRCVRGIDGVAPSKHEIVGGYGLAIAPSQNVAPPLRTSQRSATPGARLLCSS